MKKSDSIVKLAVALAKFNSEVGRIAKDAKNPHFKNNYATHDQLLDATRPILAQHGISVLQFPSGDEEGRVIVTTMLMHESGEWIESDPLIMKPVKADPQGVGSCITYAKRYSLAAILSLSTGADDDGNAASFVGQPARQPQQQVTRNDHHTPNTYSEHEQIPNVDGKLVEIPDEQPPQQIANLYAIKHGNTDKLHEWYNKERKRGYSAGNLYNNLYKDIAVPEGIRDTWMSMYADKPDMLKKVKDFFIAKRSEGMSNDEIEAKLAQSITEAQTAAGK